MDSGYVQIESIINEACERLGISNPEAYTMRFLNLIITAEKKIYTGSSKTKKYSVYEVGSESFKDGRRILIPHDMLAELKVKEIDDEDKLTIKLIDPCDFDKRGNWILFKEARTKAVVLEYDGLLFDLNDMPVISHNHEEAVVSYLVYMETTTRYFSKKVPRYVYIDSKTEWSDRLGEARGDDMFASPDEHKNAAAEYYAVKLYSYDSACSYKGINDLLLDYTPGDGGGGNPTPGPDKTIKTGSLDIGIDINFPSDYNEGMLRYKEEEQPSDLSSDNYYFNAQQTGRIVFAVPFSAGQVTEIRDAFNANILESEFKAVVDELAELTIYVSKNMMTPAQYKLKFTFVAFSNYIPSERVVGFIESDPNIAIESGVYFEHTLESNIAGTWFMLDNKGTNIILDRDNGVLSGGPLEAGLYNIMIAYQSYDNKEERLTLNITVT